MGRAEAGRKERKPHEGRQEVPLIVMGVVMLMLPGGWEKINCRTWKVRDAVKGAQSGCMYNALPIHDR